MPAYHYIALNKQQKELAGVIEAPDESAARIKLKELELSVVSLSTVAGTQTPTGTTKKVFDFEALDKNSKKVVGTIVGEDPLAVYTRLFDEYELNVLLLIEGGASAKEKETARKEGVAELQARYTALKGMLQEKNVEEEQAKNAQLAEKKELMAKVEQTTERVRTFLATSANDIKPEEREMIQSYIDQLLRIKDSTNLEHIRNTCERMLKHIQSQELFVHQKERMRESARLKLDTRNLLEELNRSGLNKDIDVRGVITGWQQHPVLKYLARLVNRIFKPDSPAIAELKTTIRATNAHMWSYYKAVVTASSSSIRLEAWESLKTLRAEKQRLKERVQVLRMQERLTETQLHPKTLSTTTTIALCAGWILAFYLLSYIISYPFTIKVLSTGEVPSSFFFYKTQFTKLLTLGLFALYATLTIRITWLNKSPLGSFILYPVSVFLFFLMVINLV